MARLQDFQTVTPIDSDNLLVVQATGQGLASVGSTLGAKLDKANPTGTGSLSLNRQGNTAVGTNSSALGTGAIANHLAQHVFGEYNLADTSTAQPTSRGNYVEIVGKGTGNNSRSNARTLDWSGNEVLAGDLTFSGAISLANMNKVAVSDRQYVIQSGTLSANSYGYIAVSINLPSGYKTTGWSSIYLGHPAAAGGLQLCGGIQKKQTGTITIYLSYFTPVAIAATNTDFFVNVGIINSNVNID